MNQIRKKMLMTATALGLVVFLCASHARAFVPVVDGGNSPVNNDAVGAGETQEVNNGGVINNGTATGAPGGMFGTINVNEGGRSNRTTINNYGIENINNGASSDQTVVNNGSAQQNVNAGGIANETTINSGSQFVNSGGVANDAIVNGGAQTINGGVSVNTTVINGKQIVLSGSVADGTVIKSGGNQSVSDGGQTGVAKVTNTIIEAGGLQTLTSQSEEGIVVSHNTVINGGVQNLSGYTSGSVNVSDYDTVINNGGFQNANAYTQTFNTTVNSGGVQSINADAVSNGTVINTGGVQETYGTSNDTIINGGKQTIHTGATANDTIVNAGGWQEVDSNTTSNKGVANNTIVNAGGLQNVSTTGGLTNNTVVNTGGRQDVQWGGEAVGTQVNGGYQYVDSGTVKTTTISNGGVQEIQYALSLDGTEINNGGTQILYSSDNLNNININAGGTQQIESGVTVTNASTNLNAGGIQMVKSGATAQNMVVNGYQHVLNGGTTDSSVINSGGAQFLYDQSTVSGNETVNGGGYIYAVPTSPVEILGTGTITFNGGTLSAIDPSVMPALGTNYGTITVHPTVTGQGNINIRGNETAAAAGTDYDTFTFDNITGTFNVNYLSSNPGVDHPERIETVITDTAQTGTFQASNSGVDLGSYRYTVENNAGIISLVRSGFSGSAKTPILLNAIALGAVAYLSDPMTKRVGELSLTENRMSLTNRLWANYINKDMTIVGQNLRFQGVEAGYDIEVLKDAANKLYVGVLGLYAKADTNINFNGSKASESDIDAKGLGLYAVYTNKFGWFADAVVREFWYGQKIRSSGNDYKTNQNATTLNLEAGKRIKFDCQQFTNIAMTPYITPSVELASVWLGGDKTTTNGGGRVKMNSGSMYRGAINTRFGMETNMMRDQKIDPYVTVGVLYDVGGDAKASYNQTSFKEDLGGFGYEVGGGVNYRLNDRIHAYGEYRYQNGKEYDMKQFNIGLNVKF